MSVFNIKTWLDSIVEYPTRRTIHDVNAGTDTVVTVTRNVGTVTQEGDLWNATNMNGLEGRIATAFDNVGDVNDFTITTTWVANADTGDYSTYPYKQVISTTKFTNASETGYCAPNHEIMASTPDSWLTEAQKEDIYKINDQIDISTSGITLIAKEATTNTLTLRVYGLGIVKGA